MSDNVILMMPGAMGTDMQLTPTSLSPAVPETPSMLATARQRAAEGKLPPLIVIGGGANALSIARSMARRGVPVYALNKPGAAVVHSRYAERIRLPHDEHYMQVWSDYLRGEKSEHLRGAVLLAASDVGLELIANHRDELSQRYLLDDSNPSAQLVMLDKLATYRVAEELGTQTPKFWSIASTEDLRSLQDALVYPLLVKPKSSYAFTDRFRGKFFVANSFDEVVQGCDRLMAAGVECLLVEKIPGPDDLLCSYYTYLDEAGTPLFDFTKRIIRRYPPNMGLACYHITDWNPAVRDVALPLFQGAGLRGLANAEFKLDQRDGKLKLIECNARFTEANGLIADCGFDLAQLVYNRILDIPQESLTEYRTAARLWYPLDDVRAFLALRKAKQLTFWQWFTSILHYQRFPLFRWTDPLPSLAALWHRLSSVWRSPKRL